MASLAVDFTRMAAPLVGGLIGVLAIRFAVANARRREERRLARLLTMIDRP